MKSKTIFSSSLLPSLLALLSFTLASCSKEESEPAGGGSETVSTETADSYPLTTCVVSGEELGGMGEPVEYDHNGTLVKFCCKNCIPKFEADPEKYMAKLK